MISWVRLTPPRVRTIWAGSFSLPLRRPVSTASRTAFSISRCEVMPTFFRNLRRLVLKTSSFMAASLNLRMVRMGQHIFAEVALAAGGAGGGGGAVNGAVFAGG